MNAENDRSYELKIYAGKETTVNIRIDICEQKSSKYTFDVSVSYSVVKDDYASVNDKTMHKSVDSIDLSVIDDYKIDITDQFKVRGLLNDLYPEKRRDINIIMQTYLCDLHNRIKDYKSIDERTFFYLCHYIENETGIKEMYSVPAIKAWANYYGINYVELSNDEIETSEEYDADIVRAKTRYIVEGIIQSIKVTEREFRGHTIYIENNSSEMIDYFGVKVAVLEDNVVKNQYNVEFEDVRAHRKIEKKFGYYDGYKVSYEMDSVTFELNGFSGKVIDGEYIMSRKQNRIFTAQEEEEIGIDEYYEEYEDDFIDDEE